MDDSHALTDVDSMEVIAELEAAVGRKERENAVLRIQLKQHQQAMQGLAQMGAGRPFGLQPEAEA